MLTALREHANRHMWPPPRPPAHISRKAVRWHPNPPPIHPHTSSREPRMITSISNRHAKLDAGWALMSTSPNFPTHIRARLQARSLSHLLARSLSHLLSHLLTIPTTILSICVKCSRARNNRWQANQMCPAGVLGCDGQLLKSLVPGLRNSPPRLPVDPPSYAIRMKLNNVEIADTFAEAFPMTAARVLVTAETAAWARTAGQLATGYAASVIGCDAEAGIERELAPDESPDGRPGVSLLFFGFSRDALQKALVNRVAQCILTCPTTACYNGLPIVPDKTVRIGGNLRFFGDGWQFSKKLEGRRFWRVPGMDGEFFCGDRF